MKNLYAALIAATLTIGPVCAQDYAMGFFPQEPPVKKEEPVQAPTVPRSASKRAPAPKATPVPKASPAAPLACPAPQVITKTITVPGPERTVVIEHHWYEGIEDILRSIGYAAIAFAIFILGFVGFNVYRGYKGAS